MGHYPIKQKARPVPLHLQGVGRELEKLIKSGHLEKINDVDEDCFVSPGLKTVKSDNSVKVALDSRKLNESCIEMRPHMSNMGELLNQLSVKITRDRTVQLFISIIDLDYAYGQMKISEETSRRCVSAITGRKGFTVLPIYLQCFKKKMSGHSNIEHRHD